MIKSARSSPFFQATVTEFRHDGHLDGVIGHRRERRDAEHRNVPGGPRRGNVVGRLDGDACEDDGVDDDAADRHLRCRRRHRKRRPRQEHLRAERAASGRPDQRRVVGERLDVATAEAEEESEPHRGNPKVSVYLRPLAYATRNRALPSAPKDPLTIRFGRHVRQLVWWN